MIVVAITASSVDIMGKLLRSGLADRTNEEGHVLTLLNRHSILHPSAFIKDRGVEDFHTECRSDCACPTGTSGLLGKIAETKCVHEIAASSGLFALNREISVCARTSNQTIIGRSSEH
jgi:hypothetical protein